VDGENAIGQTGGRMVYLIFGKLEPFGAFDSGQVDVNNATNAVGMPIAAGA